MKESLLALLKSPCCGGDMRFFPRGPRPNSAGDWEGGELACACGRRFAVEGGMPLLAFQPDSSPETAQSRADKTKDSFSWEWQRYPGPLPEDEKILLQETQLAPGDFPGRLVLDAGCGMGRYSLAALSLGAQVVAVDSSQSLTRLLPLAGREPRLHVVQGDLLNPPLKDGVFDLAYSQGVLHHTQDTRLAFRSVARLVKPGGRFSVWVYGKAGSWREFSTNPLRSDRAWIARHRFLAWGVVAARHWFSDLLRLATTRLPIRLTYALCWPLALLGAVPALKYLTFSVHPLFKVRLIENFDWLSPPYQHHHTKEELLRWFEEQGYEALSVLPHGLVPKPGVLGRRRA